MVTLDPVDLNVFKSYRNKLNKELHMSKSAFQNSFFNKKKNNLKLFWKYLNDICLRECKGNVLGELIIKANTVSRTDLADRLSELLSIFLPSGCSPRAVGLVSNTVSESAAFHDTDIEEIFSALL